MNAPSLFGDAGDLGEHPPVAPLDLALARVLSEDDAASIRMAGIKALALGVAGDFVDCVPCDERGMTFSRLVTHLEREAAAGNAHRPGDVVAAVPAPPAPPIVPNGPLINRRGHRR